MLTQNIKVQLAAVAVLVASTYLTVASAQIFTPSNYSFESPALASNPGYNSEAPGQSTAIPDWTYAATDATKDAGEFITTAPDGNQVAYIDSYSGETGSLTSSAITITIGGDAYNLSVYLGGESATSLGSYTIFLLDTNINTNTSTIVGQNTLAESSITPGTYTDETLLTPYTAAASGDVLTAVLQFTTTGTGNSAQGLFDDVTLTQSASVPEPSTWAMMLGGLGLLFVVLRRRSASLV